ncbi:MAG: glycerophosphodiester phosphodiesterase [Actinomycetota bacterium]
MTKVCAHRGASLTFKENTLEAFTHAVTLGSDWVELDVWLASDGNVVVHHDQTVGTDLHIQEVTVEDLPNDVPLLGAAMEACAGAHMNIELKVSESTPTERLVDSVLDVIGSASHDQQFLLSSFSRDVLEYARATSSTVQLGFLTIGDFKEKKNFLQGLKLSGFQSVHPHYLAVDVDFVVISHEYGLEVNVWTVNDEDRMEELIGFGVDGIITDVPDVALEVVKRRDG